jgi:hypothetical protein
MIHLAFPLFCMLEMPAVLFLYLHIVGNHMVDLLIVFFTYFRISFSAKLTS